MIYNRGLSIREEENYKEEQRQKQIDDENTFFIKMKAIERETNDSIIVTLKNTKTIELINKQKTWPFKMVDTQWNIISDKFININEEDFSDVINEINSDDSLINTKIFFKSNYWKIVKKYNILYKWIKDIPEDEWLEKEFEWYRYNYLSSTYKKIIK